MFKRVLIIIAAIAAGFVFVPSITKLVLGAFAVIVLFPIWGILLGVAYPWIVYSIIIGGFALFIYRYYIV